jgi:shikimate dehydrogenase
VAAVIGDPIEHSLSPVLHNSAFAEMGIDWVYVAFRVAPGQGRAAVDAMRTLDLAGLSVTMPHKAEVAAAVDHLGPVAARLGVVNTVSWSRTTAESELIGESTDGAGFIDALRGDEGFDPAGRSCVVLGAGGAARAVTVALVGSGASRVTVAARRIGAARSCAELAGPAGEAVAAPGEAALAGDEDRRDLRRVVSEADLVVNATPVGMGSGGLPLSLRAEWLKPTQFMADLIYAPATTPLLAAARAAGAAGSNGIGMLIHQAGRQIELWTGRPAPLAAMSAAAIGALAHGGDRH